MAATSSVEPSVRLPLQYITAFLTFSCHLQDVPSEPVLPSFVQGSPDTVSTNGGDDSEVEEGSLSGGSTDGEGSEECSSDEVEAPDMGPRLIRGLPRRLRGSNSMIR